MASGPAMAKDAVIWMREVATSVERPLWSSGLLVSEIGRVEILLSLFSEP